MKKLPAFTLMELLIGMIISSLVIAFGYGAYVIINEQYYRYKTIKAELMEAAQFNTVFANDLRQAEISSSNEGKILLSNRNAEELQYEFSTTFIVRKNRELTDTFKLAPVNLKQQFLFPENGMFLQQLSFEVNVLKEQERFNFTKAYSSEVLMNYKASLKSSL